MTFDDQLRTGADRLLTDLQTHLDTSVRAFTDELNRAVLTERTRAATQAAEAAAAEVHLEAQIHLADVRATAKRELDELRKATEAQMGELTRQLEQVRRSSEQQLQHVRETADAEIATTREHAAAEIEDARRVAYGQVQDVQKTMEDRIAEVRSELAEKKRELEATRRQIDEIRASSAASAEELVIAQLAVAHAENEQKLTEVEQKIRTDSHQSELARASRLVDAIRSLDDARTIGEVLDGLAQFAAPEADRVAVLLVKGDRLQGWRFNGFSAAPAVAKSLTLTLEEAGLPGAVVRAGIGVSRAAVSATHPGVDHQPALPPFAQDAGTRHAIGLPMIVDGQVVAVLYADAPRPDVPSSASRWPAVLEVLTRHASRVLETVTLQKAAGLSLPRVVNRSVHASLPGPVEHGGADGSEDLARRYARLLLSEIRMFNEPTIDAGRRSRDLRMRLSGEIDRARTLYETRVPASVERRSDYFEQELVRTLADGDRTLLGEAR